MAEFEITELWLRPTKAGNGFKIAIGDVWLYAPKHALLDLLENRRNAIVFRTIAEPQA